MTYPMMSGSELLVAWLWRHLFYQSPHCGGRGQDIFETFKTTVRPSVITFFFELHSGTVPVKIWLYDKEIFMRWKTKCLFMKEAWEYWPRFRTMLGSNLFWDVLQRTIKNELPFLNPSGTRLLPVENSDVPCELIILPCLHRLWKMS